MDHREQDNQNTKPMNQDAIFSGEEQEEEVISSLFYGDHVVLTGGKGQGVCVCMGKGWNRTMTHVN